MIPDAAAKLLCVGINYMPHIKEMGRERPERPVLFVRFGDSIVGHGQPLLKPRESEQFDYEGELAVVIGKRARRVSRERALDYVAGYSCFNDGSVRDYQRHSPQFTPGKNFHASGAFGPWLVTADEIPDPRKLTLTTRLNGAVMQHESVGELCFDVPQLIEYCSTWTQLEPGDVIVTGTPGGVGAGRKPPVWMKPGDTVEVEISGIGTLRNPVSPTGLILAACDENRRRSPLLCCTFARGARSPISTGSTASAVAAREVHVNAERGDRPLTVDVKLAAEVDAAPAAIWDVLTACEIAPEYVPNVVSCKKLEELDGGRADLFVQTIKPIFFLPTFEHVFRLDYTPYTRIDVNRVSGPIAHMQGSWWLAAAGQRPHPARLRARARSRHADPALHGARDAEARPAESHRRRARARRSRRRTLTGFADGAREDILGSDEYTRGRARRRSRMMHEWARALRRLRRRPASAAAIVITVALGIGVSAGMFSVLHGVVLRALPYPDAERLVRIYSENPALAPARGGLTRAEVLEGLPGPAGIREHRVLRQRAAVHLHRRGRMRAAWASSA